LRKKKKCLKKKTDRRRRTAADRVRPAGPRFVRQFRAAELSHAARRRAAHVVVPAAAHADVHGADDRVAGRLPGPAAHVVLQRGAPPAVVVRRERHVLGHVLARARRRATAPPSVVAGRAVHVAPAQTVQLGDHVAPHLCVHDNPYPPDN